jgi:hypothetical protein
MKLREAFFLGEVGVPQADYLENVELPGEVTANPAVGEVHEVDVKGVQVL